MKVYHSSRTRSFRVVWMLEEMGLEYEIHALPFPAGADPALLAVNPLGTLPAFVDGDLVMTESVAILEYLARRYGPTPLAPAYDAPNFGLYLEYLHFGEATLASYLTHVVRTRFAAPEDQKDNWTIRAIEAVFQKKAAYLATQLQSRPYVAGDDFTAADISVGYALAIAHMLRLSGDFDPALKDYLKRINSRPAHLSARDK